MKPDQAEATIRIAGAVVILRGIEYSEVLERLADMLLEEGFKALEVTLNGPSAPAAITQLREYLGYRALVGAGTVRTASDVQQAIEAGAQFLVAPCLDIASVHTARDKGLLLIPGVFTASEAQQAHSAGCKLLKLFPAHLLGPGYLKALRAPLDDLAFVPTGGIDVDNVGAYIKAGAVAVGIGSSLTRYTGDLRSLKSQAARVREAIREAREERTADT